MNNIYKYYIFIYKKNEFKRKERKKRSKAKI